MATEGHQSFNAEAESVEQTGISSGLKAVESDSDLRRKRLPYRIFSPNLEVNTIDTPRSCSANGTYSRDTPLTISLPRETKAAFENSTVLHDIKAGDKEKRDDELSSPRITDDMTQTADDPSDMATANAGKNEISEESESVNTPTPQGEDRTVATTREEPGDKLQVLLSGPIHDALFTPRAPASERAQYVLRDKRKSLVPSEVNSTKSCQQPQSTENTGATDVVSQFPIDFNVKKKDGTEGAVRDTSLDEHHKKLSKETVRKTEKATNRNKQTGNEATNTKEEIINDTEKTGEDTEEQSDAIKPLTIPPFVQSETNRRRRSSTASLQHFPAAPPTSQTGIRRSRRISIVDAPHFPTPSTSGQVDTSQALQEAAMKLSTQSSAGSSDVPGTRRDSQARRRSSVAASIMSSDTRGSKKGSIGFTLAASLVKWKMNTLRAAKKTNATIAKNDKHQELMDRTADRIKTELPRPLLVSIQEEACPIILRTAQAYRSQLGAKHKLTIQAYDRLADLIRDLKSPY